MQIVAVGLPKTGLLIRETTLNLSIRLNGAVSLMGQNRCPICQGTHYVMPSVKYLHT